ncbi:cathepsin J-like isoform X2 [Acomys russatus]|uniref:cathepsin J-like isoform X2 n=1 Tax=Acomys russatus TaxID=60746 RepID=UPI0021E29DD5|nr:cathepsin J-like isoform X2 [Acomys russatus]
MAYAIFVLILCFGLAAGAPPRDSNLDYKWEEWKMKHNKIYSTEEPLRRAIWEENVKMIKLHNEKNGLESSFTMDVNGFADSTGEEYRKSLHDIPVPAALSMREAYKHLVSNLPASKNWVKEGYVTPVRNQGKCGSCWAFTAIGAIEGQMFSKTGNLTSLSVQNLIDCSKPQGNNGCVSGYAYNAFEYVQKNGVEAEETYPYEEKEGPCRYSRENASAYVTSFVALPQNELYLLIAVAAIGPVAAAVDASHDSFRFYSGGIYHEPNCSSYYVNHAVLVVGYGFIGSERNGNEYWLIKNSWGKGWGIDGYMMLSRGRNNHCGIASQASYPDVF